MSLDPNTEVETDAEIEQNVSDNDFLNMSDEDFLKASEPEAEPSAAAEPAKDENAQTEAAAGAEAGDAADEDKAKDAAADAGADGADNANGDDPAAAKSATAEADAGADADGKSADDKAAGKTDAEKAEGADKDKAEVDGKAEEKAPDYESFFKQVMAPFKANGREFQLKTPEEAIRLMQMGAGYGRKLQDLQPALKTLKMLEKANLLDEGKLSFLIDINNKNPDAIKKLIADSGIDPLDINTGDNVTYSPTNHSVTDKEMAFSTRLEEIQSLEGGKDTLRLVNQTWDQESKELLWEQPDILQVMHEQRVSGFYDQIVAEAERQKILGKIPQNASFIQAYKAAGDYLQATNGFKTPDGKPIVIQSQDPTPAPAQPQPIATRTAAPKAQVQNDAQAEAAASTKSTPGNKPGAKVNPLSMSDEDFLKQFEGRL